MFEVAELGADADEAALVAHIGELETLKAVAAAAQARATAALASARAADEVARGVPAGRRGRGLATEVGLARRDSPTRGNQHLGFAKALVHEMPHTLAALESGVLSPVAGDVDRAGVGVPRCGGSPGVGCRVVW